MKKYKKIIIILISFLVFLWILIGSYFLYFYYIEQKQYNEQLLELESNKKVIDNIKIIKSDIEIDNKNIDIANWNYIIRDSYELKRAERRKNPDDFKIKSNIIIENNTWFDIEWIKYIINYKNIFWESDNWWFSEWSITNRINKEATYTINKDFILNDIWYKYKLDKLSISKIKIDKVTFSGWKILEYRSIYSHLSDPLDWYYFK